MTEEMTAHHAAAPTATLATVPASPAIVVRAGRMSLRIAEIAASSTNIDGLADKLTSYLRDELGSDAVALLSCFRKERAHGGVSKGLRPAGVACDASRAGESERNTRRLMASGYRVLSAHRRLGRAVPASVVTSSAAVTIGVPLGVDDLRSVLVARWDAAPSARPEDLRSLLEVLRPTLVLATRPPKDVDDLADAGAIPAPKPTVFAVTSEAILTLDDTFTIREVNPAFTSILGWSEPAAVGRRCSDLLRCRDDRRMLLCGTSRCPLMEAFSSTSATPVRELSWETQTGKSSEVSASFTVQRTGHTAEAVIVARDVTLVNAANRMRANFISMVSHELRTPLNSINGFLEIVLESPVGPLNERQREFLNYARISTQQLTTLVEDILFISKADSGQFTLRLARTRLARAMESAVQAVQPAAEKAQVGVVTEMPQRLPTLRADDLRIQQVLTNLLGNAIKFSPAESEVHLSVSAKDEALLFAVSDQGKGIAPEDHARIFERFYQSDSNVRNRAGGYGLGLSIAKLIVEQHHGRIWVESEPGAGATFYFTLPLESV